MCSCILLKVDISSKFHLTGLAKYELFVLLCWKVFATEFDNWLGLLKVDIRAVAQGARKLFFFLMEVR